LYLVFQVAAARFYWNDACSGFMLCRFVDIVEQGQKTDKGFKDVHLNQVARMVTTLCSGIQVYNHLRFWRVRWVKVCKLKQMNETGWDEALDSDHYDGVVKVYLQALILQLYITQ